MNFESRIIELINGVMPVSPLRTSVSGEVDSEVILLGDKEYLFTTDDFSQEDMLREHDPAGLGWNIACGAISDIIAAGGKPLVYSHSMVIPAHWDEVFVRSFTTGISRVLSKYSVSFAGGDLGVGDKWRYTASVIGEPVGKKVNRRGCQAGDAIFITGKIGAGNLEAALNMFADAGSLGKLLTAVKTRFSTHEKLPAILSRYATSAIDTSDGVLPALQTISTLNGTGFRISNPPFISTGVMAATLLHLPVMTLFLGECGEYEILFTVRAHDKAALIVDLQKLRIEACELGEITAEASQQTVSYNRNLFSLAEYDIRARDFPHVKDYLRAMTEWLSQRGSKA